MIISHNTPNRAERANEIRDRKIAQGFTWNGDTFQIDHMSMGLITGRATKIMSVNSRGGNYPNFHWRAMDDSLVEFTPDGFLTFAEAVDDYVESLYQEAWQLKDGT